MSAGGAGDAETGRARGGQRRGLHAVERHALPHPVPWRLGRRELGQHGGRSRDRHGLRAQPRDAQLSQDVAGEAGRGGGAPAIRGRRARATGLRDVRPDPAPRATGRARCRCAHRRRSASENFRTLVRKGQPRCRRFPKRSCPTTRLEALEAYLLTLGTSDEGDRGRSERAAAAAAESVAVSGPADALQRRVLGRLVHQQRLAGIRSAVDAAGRLRPERRLDEVAHRRRNVARARRQGHHRHGQRAAEERSGRRRPAGWCSSPTTRIVCCAPSTRRTGACSGSTRSQPNPEGIPAVYAVDGRQYIAFAAGASWGTGGDPVWRNAFHRKPSETKAQGYYVFALPAAQ